MTSLARNGAKYRTRLLARPLAEAFARCLRANGRFTGISLEESRISPNPVVRWYVSFHPSDPEAMKAVLDAQQALQHQRADEQWRNYLVAEGDRPHQYLVQSFETGGVYDVDVRAGTCTCRHYLERCLPACIECKHPRICRLHVERGTVMAPVAPPVEEPIPFDPAVQARREQAQRDRVLLWD